MKKDKSVSWLIRVFSLAILLGTTIWTINRTGILSLIGTEDVYWERARFLLGQGGASLYDGSSICSLGYSLILLPICALFKSPYAAYKAAVLLNGIFLCIAYLFATAAAKKLFPTERESFLCVASFFAVFCPALMVARSYTGPEMAVLLLIWISIYLLAFIWERENTGDLILLSICMILIGFLEITALGLILGVVIILAYFVRKKKLGEESFLAFALALLLGLAAGNIAERIMISAFAKTLGIAGSAVLSSLEVFFAGIGSFMESGYLVKLCSTFMGKLYSVLIASFLLICPALWQFFKAVIKKDKVSEETSESSDQAFPVCMVTGLFLIQFLFMCLYDVSLGLEEGMLSLSGLEMLLPSVILVGMVEIKRVKNWEAQLPAYLLLLCICTFAATSSLQGAEESLETEKQIATLSKDEEALETLNVSSGTPGANNGYLPIVQGVDETTDATTIYLAACVVMLISMILAALLLSDTKNRTWGSILKGAGTAGSLGIVLAFSCMTLNEVAEATGDVSMEQISPLASLVNEVEAEENFAYISGSEEDEKIVVLQSLLPDKEIKIISEEDAGQYNENEAIILTGVEKDKVQDTYEKALSDYQNIYMTKSYALWVPKESGYRSELEQGTVGQPVYLTLVNDEESEEEIEEEDGEEDDGTGTQTLSVRTLTYGGDLPLSVGSYRAEFYLHADSEIEGEGTLTVSDDSGTVSEQTFNEQSFDENGDAVVSIDFTDYDSMWNVEMTLSGSLFISAEVTQAYYWKTDPAYTVGLNDANDIVETAEFIRELDEISGGPGTIVYLNALASDSDNVSMNVFENYLPDNEISSITLNGIEDLDADYLIARTDLHAYYSIMDRYAIIDRKSMYTVLARVDSVPYNTYLEQYGQVLSEETKIDIRAFQGDSTSDVNSPIMLEMGDYLYHVRLQYDLKELQGADEEIAGTLYLKNKEDVLSERNVTYSELRNGEGDLEITIPFSLPEQKKKLTCQFVQYGKEDITAEPEAVELFSKNYQYGKEESDLTDILSRINAIEEHSTVSIVQTDTNLRRDLVDYTWLSDQLPWCEIAEISSSAALERKGDAILITYGLSTDNLRLLDCYSILGHAGKYTLWSKSDGSYIQKMTETGATVLSSGTKISPRSLNYMYGSESVEGDIAHLNGTSYTIYVKLQAQNLDPDDTVMVILYRDKKKTEIKTELQELLDGDTLSEKDQMEVSDLIENGYTTEELEKYIDSKVSCGSGSVAASEFGDDGTVIVSIKKSGSSTANNLMCEAYTWHNGEAEGDIIWVELR